MGILDLDLIKRNLNLKLLSIALAIFLWFYVRSIAPNPFPEGTIEASYKVDLEIQNLAPDLVVAESPPTVLVTVRGGRREVESLKPGHFKAFVDLEKMREGSYRGVPVQVSKPADLREMSVTPSKVTLTLDTVGERVVPVAGELEGKPQEGFYAGEPKFLPAEVKVKGPSSLLRELKAARAVIRVEGATMDLVQQVPVQVIDRQGNPLEKLLPSPRSVRGVVTISSMFGSKVVLVSPNLIGSPAPGFVVKRVTVDPLVVVVMVPPSQKSLDIQAISTEPISLQGASSQLVRKVPLLPPSGVVVRGERDVKVEVVIERE